MEKYTMITVAAAGIFIFFSILALVDELILKK